MPTSLAFLRCSSAMETGFVVDKGHGDTSVQPFWYSGAFEKSWWGGLKDKAARDKHAVTTWRCRRCGFLEGYAVKQPA